MRSEGYSSCLSVSVCVSVNHISLMEHLFFLKTLRYSAGNKGKNICGDLPETTAFESSLAGQPYFSYVHACAYEKWAEMHACT